MLQEPPCPTDSRSALVARACELRAQGRSVREVAVALKVPRSAVGRALLSQNPPAPVAA